MSPLPGLKRYSHFRLSPRLARRGPHYIARQGGLPARAGDNAVARTLSPKGERAGFYHRLSKAAAPLLVVCGLHPGRDFRAHDAVTSRQEPGSIFHTARIAEPWYTRSKPNSDWEMVSMGTIHHRGLAGVHGDYHALPFVHEGEIRGIDLTAKFQRPPDSVGEK